MKFGDKLIELRKKNGYSQEELAEKLGVSRQSVSKWESNNTYPETDKIIQIANLFDCSMDDLINDKVTDVESSLRKNKNNINTVWNSFLEFITNSVNMFSKMTFGEGFKCIIEILILCFLLNIAGIILCNGIAGMISNLFSFLSHERVSLLRNLLKAMFHLVWFVLSAIVVIHTFKIRYLNGYEKDKKIKEEKQKENNTTSKDEVITKDDNEKPAEFLGTLAKIVIVFIKFIAFWILISVIFTTLGLIIATVLLIAHIPVHILFLWIALLLVAGSIVSIQIISILICFIFNNKVNVKVNLIIFIACVILSGISIGLIAMTAKNIEYITDNNMFNPKTKIVEIDYKDNLVIESHGDGLNNSYKYIIDNNIENNKIIASREVDTKYFKIETYETEMDNMPVVKIGQFDNGNVKAFYDLFIKNLKKNKVYTFGKYGEDPLVIKANEETINKLIENQKKLYLIQEERNGNEINIIVHDDKVYFKYGLEGEYNALDDSIKYDVENYTCKKEIEATEYGEKYIYTCNSIDIEEE